MSNKVKEQGAKVETLLDIYIQEIGEYPLLSFDQVVDLAKKIETGDVEARQRLIRSNLRLVVSVAKKFVTRSLNLTLLGLIQEGNIGLINAVDGFEWQRGFHFSTFARECIINRIINALRNDRRTVATLSLDAPFGEDANSYSFFPNDKAISPREEADRVFLRIVLDEALSEREDIEQQIISLAYGLTDGIAHRDKEIAAKLNLQKNKVTTIRKRVLRGLKAHKRLIGLV